MALGIFSFGSWMYKAISVALLASWSISTLIFTLLNVVNDKGSLMETIGSVSLLTYLACRLILFLQPTTSRNDSIAHFFTTAHLRSRKEALVMFLISWTWLYELAYQFFFMLFATIFGGAIAVAIYNDPDLDLSESDMDNTALANIEEFTEKSGLDLRTSLNWVPPRALVYVGLILWLNFASLCVYVLRVSWRSAKVALGNSSHPPV
ncbi:hypothetical protein N7478_005344 [Penicillium angulare]|uniref:uncharacterized protein n=1 Tax=Penicillium angulare TaxID=116970 RepID=UPI00254233B4|nr:uncharacterized protein N7478_005344 [Penicillium angulare]KAJ5279972.1 hypothetical protein N7478_005344 [Penicillium angulare]